MAVTDEIVELIDNALAQGRSFALAYLPGSSTPLLFGDVADATAGVGFDIAPWLAPFAERVRVTNELTNSLPDMQVQRISTSRNEYISSVAEVIENCKARQGKTVYSRIITGNAPTSWGEVVRSFFAAHPSTFRYLFYTPATKGWMGATPELLFDFNKNTDVFHTVALAGTRKTPSESSALWDEKNIGENNFVCRYIHSRLQELGCTVETAPARNLDYGQIQHLCREISGNANGISLDRLIDAINPTPALCGWPREEAIADIARFESHQRFCYGGFIGIDSPDRYQAFVNLRCTHFDARNFCVFGGGGIVSGSDPASEWEETEAKTRLLRQLL